MKPVPLYHIDPHTKADDLYTWVYKPDGNPLCGMQMPIGDAHLVVAALNAALLGSVTASGTTAMEPPPTNSPNVLWVNGIVAARDKMPYVVLSKGMDRVGQMSMAQARNLANDLLLAASRVEADAMLLKFFSDHEFPAQAGSALMVAFRDFRASLDAQDPRQPNET